MPNLNVRARLDKIQREIDQVVKHVVQYSGVDAKDAVMIDNTAAGIAEQAARICELARSQMGEPNPNTIAKVRKALGFVY